MFEERTNPKGQTTMKKILLASIAAAALLGSPAGRLDRMGADFGRRVRREASGEW